MTMKKPPLIYIATPYSGQEEHGVRLQMETFHQLMDVGCHAFAPLLCHFLEEYRPRPYEEWLDYCLNVVSRCDGLVAFHGLSHGVRAEIQLAVEMQVPVFQTYHALLSSYLVEKS